MFDLSSTLASHSSFVSPIFHFTLLTSIFSSSMWMLPEQYPTGTPSTEESGPLAKNAPLEGHEPNFFDEYHFSELFFLEQPSGTMPSYLHDAGISDDTIGRALSSSLFTQERVEPADRRQAYHSFEESLLPSQSLSVCHVRTWRPVSSCIRENPRRDSENEQIRILQE